MALRPDLTTLQQALDNVTDNDSSALIPFINAINDFPNNDRATAATLLRSIFWTEKSSNTYDFTDRFKLLTATHLSIIIQKLGDQKIQNFIFIDNNKIILEHYPINDLIQLLGAFYSDRFAHFVFNQFKGNFLKSHLSFRVKYLQTVSVKAIIMILKTGGVGKSLSNDELIIITIKMKKYLISNRSTIEVTDNTWLDCQSISPEIIQLMIGNDKNIKTLTIQHLQSILNNDLIVNMNQAKLIINELLLRQQKSILGSIGNGKGQIDIKQQLHCDKLIGILSTDNFACFQQPIQKNNNTQMINTRVLLDGPMVIIPMNKKHKQDCINYSVLVQIQDLNPLFNQQNTNINNRNTQPKGSIFVILLQQIPNNYEVVLSVSNSYNNEQIKDLNIGMNNVNPVCIIPWPLPKIGRAVSFRLHCTLRATQRDVNRVRYGIGALAVTEQKDKDDNKNDNNSSGNLWQMTGNKMVMCIYSGLRRNGNNNNIGFMGGQQQNNDNSNRLPWINVMIYNKMTFGDMIDAATAQLGLPAPHKEKDEQKQQQQQQQQGGGFDMFGGQSQQNKMCYIV
eukprot:428286_1